MKRFLISGSSKFNNYYLFRKYVKEYLPEEAIIVTCGGVNGTDAMALEYSNREKILIEEYPVKSADQESIFRRNAQILGYCQSAIIFDDGRPGTAQHLKDSLMRTKKSVVVVEINLDKDNIDCNIDCTDKFLKEYFDLCKRSEYNIQNLADVVMAILFHEEILQHILDSKDADYPKSATTNMAAGFAWWLKHNELPYIKQRLAHEERIDEKVRLVPLEEQARIWTN